MSALKAKSEYKILIVFAIITTLFFFYYLNRERYSQETFNRTTLSNSVNGTVVFYTLCENLGVNVVRSYDPLLEDMMDSSINVLILGETPFNNISDGEIRHLKNWVSSGGVLICDSSSSRLIDYLPSSEQWDYSTEINSRDFSSQDNADLPLAKDVKEIKFDDQRWSRSNSTLRESKVEPLFSDREGIRIGLKKIGSGGVIIVSDFSFLSNGLISKADNSVLAANLVFYALSLSEGNTLAFDEYHFGFTGKNTPWTTLINTLLKTSIGWAITIVAIAGILFMYLNGRQFGTRYTPDEKRRRTKIEFIESVGNTYYSVGANLLSFKLIYQWFTARCAKLVGLPESAASGAIAAKLSTKTGQPLRHFESIFSDCEAALASGKLSKKGFISILNSLKIIEREVFYGHSDRR